MAAQNEGRAVRVPDLPAEFSGFTSGPVSCTRRDFDSVRFTRWGQSLSGPYHLFVDDYRFAVAWRNPGRALFRALSGGVCCAPDFSVPLGAPEIFLQYQVWRSETVARFWAAHGCTVIPTLIFTEFVPRFSIEPGSTVAVRGPARGSEDLWSKVVPRLRRRVKPGLVLQFGRSECSDLWGCPVINMTLK